MNHKNFDFYYTKEYWKVKIASNVRQLRLKLIVSTIGRPKNVATDPKFWELNELLEINH